MYSFKSVAWLLLLVSMCSLKATVDQWSGTQSEFHGYTQYDFKVDELDCKVVTPKVSDTNKRWLWRARFFGHEPQVDIALLEKGFHIAYVDVAGLFGSPKAVDRYDRFYDYLTTQYGFHPKPAFEAFSRGGLIAYNWTAANPEKVSCIYADAPVCDFKSWPGGKGTSEGSPNAWAQCLKAYGLTDAESMAYSSNPIDSLEAIATAGIPLLHVVGDADVVVPVAENTSILEQRYKALGGSIKVIHKPGVGHHPHCLEDPAPIVNFILAHTTE